MSDPKHAPEDAAAATDRGNDSDLDPTLGYADAVAELDQILRELESSDVDVDRLADRVTRAAALIALCRERITNAHVEIERVTADLNAATTTP